MWWCCYIAETEMNRISCLFISSLSSKRLHSLFSGYRPAIAMCSCPWLLISFSEMVLPISLIFPLTLTLRCTLIKRSLIKILGYQMLTGGCPDTWFHPCGLFVNKRTFLSNSAAWILFLWTNIIFIPMSFSQHLKVCIAMSCNVGKKVKITLKFSLR